MIDRRFAGLAIIVAFAACVLVGRWATVPVPGAQPEAAPVGEVPAGTARNTRTAAPVPAGGLWRIPVGSAPQVGPSRAPVTIIVFTDLGEAGRRLEREVVALEKQPSGGVRYALRVLSGGSTAPATEALFAAHAQGKFFALRDALGERALASVTQADVDAAATRAGIDAEALHTALQEGKARRRADADMRLAATFGVTAPTLFVNGARVDGRASSDEIARVVATQKARAEQLLAGGVDPSRLYAELTKEGRAGAGAAGEPTTAPRRREDPDAVYRVEIDGAPAKGPAGALVTIVELGDFQCPFCQRAAPALQEILDQHRADVRLVWKNAPLSSHPEASSAAAVAMAAHAQGKFWPMHDALFAAQRELGRATYERLAREAGLDVARLRRELDGGRWDTAVSLEAAAASQLGAVGTPVFYVNGRKLRGFRGPEALVALVDRELERARALVQSEHVPRAQLYDRLTREGARQPVYLADGAAAPASGPRRATVQDLLPSQTALPAPRGKAPEAPAPR